MIGEDDLYLERPRKGAIMNWIMTMFASFSEAFAFSNDKNRPARRHDQASSTSAVGERDRGRLRKPRRESSRPAKSGYGTISEFDL